MSVHNKIINIQMQGKYTEDKELRNVYADGHRDARHAAAELVAEIEVEYNKVCSELAVLKMLNVQPGLTPLPTVTRVEMIDSGGRAMARHDQQGVYLSLQDDGRTLKVFMEDK